MTSSRASTPATASHVGASGVTPIAWNSATDPELAAAAPIAFSRSSESPGGRPSIAATSFPARRPSTCPSTGYTRSSSNNRVRHALDAEPHGGAPSLIGMQAVIGSAPGDRARRCR